jgi:hypothetical protein
LRVIVGRADERLHLGALEQAVDIVIVPHEIDGKFLRRLLLREIVETVWRFSTKV